MLLAHDGILANSETVSGAGAPRSGLRLLRIPVAEFDDFMKALAELGEVQRSKIDVQDITRSFSELEDQVRNMTAEVAGLRELLKKPTEKLADTLAVREQLAKATRELASLDARVKRMRAQAEYSTVTLRLLERSGYAGAVLPLGTSASRTLQDSWEAMIALARGTVLLFVFLLPWLLLIAVAALPLLAWRRRRRATASA
jgi:predicted RNase H-like nuclease (RuvC/YqgF family)